MVQQPRVSLGVSLSVGLGGWLSLSLLYGHDGLLSGLSRGGSSSEGSEGGQNSVSAGDEGTFVIPTSGSGGVDEGNMVVSEGVVIGHREMVVHQRCSPNTVGESRVGLSSSIGSDG